MKRNVSIWAVHVLMWLAATITAALTLFLVGYVLIQGIPNLSWELISTKPSFLKGTIGILPDILNTIYIVIATLVIVIPLGAGAAVYLTEYATNQKVVGIIEYAAEALSGIPSIIYGLKLLLRQQPVARDLRVISAAMKMITDMERIGDQAEDIVDLVPKMEVRPDEKYPKIREMAKAAQAMVKEAVDAYVRQDLELAHAVMKHDDIVDDYFSRVKAGIIGIIAENPAEGEYALGLLMIAKYFERIGDHCTNIAEWVEFSVTGIHKDCQQVKSM